MAFRTTALLVAALPALLFAASPTPLSISPSLSSPVGLTSGSAMGCVALDWWPETKCDYGTCAWGNSSFINLDLTLPGVTSALNSLGSSGPFYLRLGGSLCDFTRYDFPGSTETCVPFSEPTNATRIGFELGTGCLHHARWDELVSTCDSTPNCELIFGLNALIGRKNSTCAAEIDCLFNYTDNACCTSWSGDWDPSNARTLLEYAHDNNQDVYGFELGNELTGDSGIEAHLTPSEYADTFCVLKSMIDEIYADVPAGSRPKVITPDNNFEAEWYGEFLALTYEASCAPDVITWHQ